MILIITTEAKIHRMYRYTTGYTTSSCHVDCWTNLDKHWTSW